MFFVLGSVERKGEWEPSSGSFDIRAEHENIIEVQVDAKTGQIAAVTEETPKDQGGRSQSRKGKRRIKPPSLRQASNYATERKSEKGGCLSWMIGSMLRDGFAY